jgi:hypothetical protein
MMSFALQHTTCDEMTANAMQPGAFRSGLTGHPSERVSPYADHFFKLEAHWIAGRNARSLRQRLEGGRPSRWEKRGIWGMWGITPGGSPCSPDSPRKEGNPSEWHEAAVRIRHRDRAWWRLACLTCGSCGATAARSHSHRRSIDDGQHGSATVRRAGGDPSSHRRRASRSGEWRNLRADNVDIDGKEYGESLAMDWSREGRTLVGPTYFSRHLGRGGISTAVGLQELLGLDLTSWPLWWARMSMEPGRPVVGPRPPAPPRGSAGMPAPGATSGR